MKYATLIAAALGCALVAGTTSPGVAGASPRVAARPVATVNGIPITQAALDAALAASRQRDSAALRREFKRRLIAWEVLRQAAVRAELSASGDGRIVPDALAAPAKPQALAASEIATYLRTAVQPATVTDAELHRRYAALARASAARSSDARAHLPPFTVLAGSLREHLEVERFNEAVRRLAEQLIDQANINE